jgi:hypothetical protein
MAKKEQRRGPPEKLRPRICYAQLNLWIALFGSWLWALVAKLGGTYTASRRCSGFMRRGRNAPLNPLPGCRRE